MAIYLALLVNKKEIKRSIIAKIMPRIVWFLMWIIYITSKNRFYINEKVKKSNAILVFWHNELLMMPFLYRKIRDNPKLFIMTSQHFDGVLIEKLCKYFNLDSIKGSSSKGGVKVLIQAINKIKDNKDIAITPDGPKGPIYSIADGVIAIAQKTSANIVVVSVKSNKFLRLNTWDQLIIPLPFSNIKYYAFEPFKISSKTNINDAKMQLFNKMQQNI